MSYRLMLILLVVFAFSSEAQAAAYLGVAVGKPSGDKAKGAAIVAVVADSPAEKGGLAKGDIVLAVNKAKIAGPLEFVKAIQSMKVGEEVKLKVRRDGERQKMTVTLGEQPEPSAGPADEGTRPFIGIAFGTSASFDRPGEPDKLIVVEIVPDSPAQKAGIERGDVVVAFDGKKAESYKQLRRLVQQKKIGDEAVLRIERDGETIEKKLTLKGLRPQRQ